MNEFKDMLHYYRKRDKLTQAELAKKLHLSTSTIGMYESGKRFPTREIEEAISDYFNVNISTLRGHVEEYEDLNAETARKVNAIRREGKYLDDLVAFTRLSESDKETIVTMIRRLSTR